MINKVVMLWNDIREIENMKKMLFDACSKAEEGEYCTCKSRTTPLIRKIEFYEIQYSEEAEKAVEATINKIFPYTTLWSCVSDLFVRKVLRMDWLANKLGIRGLNSWMNCRGAVLWTVKDKSKKHNINSEPEWFCPTCSKPWLRDDI